MEYWDLLDIDVGLFCSFCLSRGDLHCFIWHVVVKLFEQAQHKRITGCLRLAC